MTTSSFIIEPRGDDYRRLLHFSRTCCDRFGLIIRSPLAQLSAHARRILQILEPNLLDQRTVTEWPGTLIFDDTATRNEYDFNDLTLRILEEAADGLFDWEEPHLPEDLFTLRPSGDVWMGSIAHERDAFLYATDLELTELRVLLPQLHIRRDPADFTSR